MDLILIVLPLALVALSQWYINASYNKYKEYDVSSKLTGAKAARMILDANGLEKVKIKKVEGTLTDNFNPSTNEVSLSEDIHDGNSIAAVSVAAHECGHVIQHKTKYAPIVIRSMLVPIVNLSSKAGYIIMVIGIMMSILKLAIIGIVLMCATLIFQLVTLPTEFDASKRGRQQLLKLDIITKKEIPQVKSMLTSAAMTYLASFFASFTQMVRLFLSLRNRD